MSPSSRLLAEELPNWPPPPFTAALRVGGGSKFILRKNFHPGRRLLQGGAKMLKCVAKYDLLNLISVPGGRRRPVPSAFHDEADDDGEEEKLGWIQCGMQCDI